MTDGQAPHTQTVAPEIWGAAFKEAGVAFVVAALILSVFYVFAFRWIHPEFAPFMDRKAKTVIAPGKDLIPVSVGEYQVEGSNTIVEGFNGDEAILALARAFQAEDYPFIKVKLTGFTRYCKFKILWRRAAEPSITHALEFNRSGDQATQIAMVYGDDNYRGQIADIALLFYDAPALGFKNNNDVDITIHSIELRPFSAWGVVEQIFEDWTNPPLWQGYSNNFVRGIHTNGMLFPSAVASLLVLTGLLVAALIRWSTKLLFTATAQHKISVTILSLCLYGWAFNDALRWHWRIEQLVDTHERYSGQPLETRIRNNNIRCARFPDDCAAHLLPYF